MLWTSANVAHPFKKLGACMRRTRHNAYARQYHHALVLAVVAERERKCVCVCVCVVCVQKKHEIPSKTDTLSNSKGAKGEIQANRGFMFDETNVAVLVVGNDPTIDPANETACVSTSHAQRPHTQRPMRTQACFFF